jgi:hypothetical protein
MWMARSPGSRWILTSCSLYSGAVAIVGLVSILDLFIAHHVSSLSDLPIGLSDPPSWPLPLPPALTLPRSCLACLWIRTQIVKACNCSSEADQLPLGQQLRALHLPNHSYAARK